MEKNKDLVIPKYAIKDSVFSSLAKRKKWLREIYLSLFPSDKEIKEDDLELITLESVFVNGIYNDVSFRVRDKLVVFIECQSTWSPNMPYRMIEYYGETIKKLFNEWNSKKFRNTKGSFPDPYFFCLYTGAKNDIPPYLYGSSNRGTKKNEFCLPVKIIWKKTAKGILKEVCLFSEIYDKNFIESKRTEETIKKTLVECIDKRILVDFIHEHRDEVYKIMRNMSQERRIKEYIKDEREEGIKEGIKEGLEVGKIKNLIELVKDGDLSFEKAVKKSGLKEEEFKDKLSKY